MRNYIYIFLLLLIENNVNAQDFKVNKVSERELLQNEHNLYSDVSAAIIYKIGYTEMKYDRQWLYEHRVDVRLKVYNNDGLSQANISVPLYSPQGEKGEIISKIEGFSYTLIDGKIQKEKLNSNAQFEEEINNNWKIKKFVIPSVKVGSVIEYSYTLISPYIFRLPEFTFQHLIPTDYVEYETKLPDFMVYKTYKKGSESIEHTQEVKTSNMDIRYVEKSNPNFSMNRGVQTFNMTYGTIVTKHVAKEIPQILIAPYINNINNYTTSIAHELVKTQMPNRNEEHFSNTWENVAEQIYKKESFGNELDVLNYFETELDPLLKDKNNYLDKINTVLNFVRTKVKWNGEYGYYTKKGVKKAFTERSGNVAEVNLMLTTMLRHAGFNANPVLLSTRSQGIPLFPTLEGFNYVISSVQINGEIILLDATNEFTAPNLLSEETLNWFGRLVKSDFTSEEINLMPTKLSKKAIQIDVKMLNSGVLEGKMRNIYTDNIALETRSIFGKMHKDSYKPMLESQFNGVQISDIQVDNALDPEKPYIETINFTAENSFDVIGDKIFFRPLFFLAITENPFHENERKFPIDFSYPKSQTIVAQITIPEGYKIEFLPMSTAHKLPENYGEFKFTIDSSEQVIKIRMDSQIKTPLLSASYYNDLKEFYRLIVEKETEKVVLVKI